MSMLNMTYMRYIENRLVCFIPGKVLDETKSILDLVEGNKSPPRTHLLLQELRDLSSMAIEHFDELILPRCKEQLEHRTAQLQRNLSNMTKQPTPSRLILHPPLGQVLSCELQKVKNVAKTHKYRITYLTQNTQRILLKLRRQNNKLRRQSAKLREHEIKHQEQERKIQEQNAKILEQDAALSDIKKHMDEWDQKYKDLTAELVRARDEILLKTSSGQNPGNLNDPARNPQFKSNIKPRRTYNFVSLDSERKRKSSLTPETPTKRSRSPGISYIAKAKPRRSIQNLTFNIPNLEQFKANDTICTNNEKGPETVDKEKPDFFSTFFDEFLQSSTNRKRKMTEDIDLK